MQDVAPTTIELNHEREDELRQWLIAHYRPVYGDGTQAYVESVLDLSGYVDRFNYLRSVAPDVFRRGAALAVSGFALGSEMIVARQLGFDPVCGVEVEHFLVEATQRRLAYLPGMQLDYYAGDTLPYPDEAFTVVTSGHVIEHTRDPALYLRECMRVLQSDGVLALEFPTRYHYRELHTRLPSLEWLPKPMRNLGLQALSHPKRHRFPAR
ncbi:MAG: class I SAM-dependent methyltransferase [Anaerolineales bacterium]|nr:class I SAM-dependent methyltransferase [Anaerolineales bacterium]